MTENDYPTPPPGGSDPTADRPDLEMDPAKLADAVRRTPYDRGPAPRQDERTDDGWHDPSAPAVELDPQKLAAMIPRDLFR